MKRSRDKFITGVLALALIPVAFAACGGSSNKSTTAAAAATGTSSGTVKVASTGLGKILVNSNGLTLYLFEADKGTTSTCSGACAAAWPPLVTSDKPTAGDGVNASLLGTTKRSDGTTQVTYNGHPLYRFASDTKPGDTTGQGVNGFGALWYGLSAAGSPITTQQASTGAGSGGNANPY
jgi:predicted lipoprotein with Yx(FWY)xxD motif